MDTRYAIACGGGGIVLVPRITVMKAEHTDQVVYGMLKEEGIYRYVIVARKKGRILPKEAQEFWRFMVGQRFRNTKLE